MRKLLMGLMVLTCLLGGCATKVVRAWATRQEKIIAADEENDLKMIGRIELHTGLARGHQRALLVASAWKIKTAADREKFALHLEDHMQAVQNDFLERMSERSQVAANHTSMRKCLYGMIKASESFGTTDEVNARLDAIETILLRVTETK